MGDDSALSGNGDVIERLRRPGYYPEGAARIDPLVRRDMNEAAAEIERLRGLLKPSGNARNIAEEILRKHSDSLKDDFALEAFVQDIASAIACSEGSSDGKMRELLKQAVIKRWAKTHEELIAELVDSGEYELIDWIGYFCRETFQVIDEALATPAPSPIAKEPHEILGDQRIGVELQSIPDNGYGASPIDAAGMRKLIHAAREFVRKVESGEARSKQSYGEFKAALHEIDNAAPQSPKAIRAEALEQAAKIADDFDWYSMGGPQDIGPNAIEKVSDEIATAIRSLGDRG